MAALVSLIPLVPAPLDPARDGSGLSAAIGRPTLRLVWRRPTEIPRPFASWRRMPDGCLVCIWALPAEPPARS